jgi:hypothetical protein
MPDVEVKLIMPRVIMLSVVVLKVVAPQDLLNQGPNASENYFLPIFIKLSVAYTINILQPS